MIKFKSLNQSNQFLKILKKNKINNKYFTLYFDKNKKNIGKYLNISFVMKKKIGNAVVRNKIKRKLKSAVHKTLKEKQEIDLNYTYVIFGKNNVYSDKFSVILKEVNNTFGKIKKENSWFMKLITNFLILLIKVYKYFVSPYFPSNCRYLPTCSEYFIDTLKLNGFLKGTLFGIKRILRCHPIKFLGGSSGLDPVVKFKKGKR